MSKGKSNSETNNFLKALVIAIGAGTVAYYKWANGLQDRKIAIGAMVIPPFLLLGLVVGSGADSSQQSQPIVTEPSSPVSTPTSSKQKEPSAPTPEATYPITVTRTGLDFRNTFDGKMEVYSKKTVITATWTPECGDIAPVDYQTQKFTYTLFNNSTEMKTVNEFSDCMNNKGTLRETDTYRIDSDGTIRVDLVEADGSLIQEDFIVIAGGPEPQATVESEVEIAAAPDPEPIDETEPIDILPVRPVYSTCQDYNAAGYGNFVSTDPEYTSKRDRDGDGIACEF